MFTYIKPEFMIHAFCQQRDTTLLERSICVARLGDFAVMMEKVNDEAFSLSLENVSDGAMYAGKIFNIKNLKAEDVTPIVESLFRQMQVINEKETFDKRETIWKWYALSWLDSQDISPDEYLDNRLGHIGADDYPHWKSFEEYISQDYLSVAQTMDIISRYAGDDEEKEKFKKFAAKDIVEIRQRHSLEAMQEEFAARTEGYETKKTYGFGIEVVADSRMEAREKLEALLKDTLEGEFIIRG